MVNKSEIPFTFENSSNPWLMDSKTDDRCIVINDNKITAKYLWTLNSVERQKCLDDVFKYYRINGFPYEHYTDDYCIQQFKKLKEYKSTKVISPTGEISNNGNLCLDVCRHFCADKFWKASNETMDSIEDIFYNDEHFRNVLKNRMGWNTTKEGTKDGEPERPYLFGITDNMIRSGIRNSANGYGVSNFRPTIAKFIYEKYLSNINHPIILDYSGGWGARALAAASLGYDYYGIDPLTATNINTIGEFLHSKCEVNSVIKCIESGSEIEDAYINIPKVNMALSCPPYFNLEVYDKSESQSYNKYNNFNSWIENYWEPTVVNCTNKIKDDGYFVLIMKDEYNKLPLIASMQPIIEKYDFRLIDDYVYKTNQSHLSGKAKSKKVTKSNEHILVFKRDE